MKEDEKTNRRMFDELAGLREQLDHFKKSSEARLNTLLNALPVGVFLSNSEGEIVQTNELAREILSSAELYKSYWPLPQADANRKEFTEDIIDIERLDGTKGAIHHYSVPIVNDREEIDGAIVVVQDFTKRQLLNNLLKRALDDITIDEFVKVTLNVVMSLPFLDKRGIVYLVEEPETFVLKSFTGIIDSQIIKRFPVGGCLCRKTDEKNRIQFINKKPCSYLADIGFSHNLCIPILKGRKLLGIMCLCQKKKYSYPNIEHEFLVAVSDALASFISRKNAEEAIIRNRDNLEMMVNERTAALQKANDKITNILESITDGFYALDNDLRFVYINREAKRILGQEEIVLIGRYIWDDFSQPPVFYENLHKAIRQKKSVHFEYLCPSVGRWLEMHFYPLEDGISAYFRDVSERKQTEEKMLQLAAIVESSSDGILSCTVNGLVLSWNKAAEQIFGYKAQEVVGQNILRLVPGERKKQMKKILISLLNGKAVNQYDTDFIKKDGTTVSICFSAAPIQNSQGQIDSISIITRDITERNRFEREMSRIDRLDLIGQMSASIGHEVRNPMTTVRGFLQMLGEKESDKTKKGYYDLMIEELDRANAIITEFLSLAKDKVAKLENKNINDILESLYTLILVDALKQDKFIEIEKGTITIIAVDEKEIRQLILNLVRNGLDAMDPGGKILIKTYTAKDELIISVRDQGKGISSEILDKLGTPFVTTKSSGTGLGLAVCYSIVNRHNGKIDVTTGPKGTTFDIKFKICGHSTELY